MPDTLTIQANLRSYTVEFVRDYREALRASMSSSSMIVCDADVYALYRDDLREVISENQRILIGAVEASKTLRRCEDLIMTLVARRFRRNQLLIALGGGVIQDIVGFVATVLYRGVDWVFVPTTLLAQADSCVGSKSSINLGETKNLIGTFYPPSAIFIDVRFLDTLSEDDVRSGIGEIMHFYLYADSPLQDRLAAEYANLLRDRAGLRPHIEESLRIKQRVVEVDEFDRGERHKFNYGHTFGHALESITGYGIKHGLAVTVGMDLANFISRERGLLAPAAYEGLHRWLALNFPTYDWASLDIDHYMEFLGVDKKNVSAELTCVLARGSGRLVVERLAMDRMLAEQIERYFREVAPNTRR